MGTDRAQQLQCGHSRPACGDQVVDQEHPLARCHSIAVYLDLIGSVFERVGDAHGLVRQLALLSHRHEARAEAMGDGTAQDEAARLDAGDFGDPRGGGCGGIRCHQGIHRRCVGERIAEQRGDVAELDAGLRIVRYRADAVFDHDGTLHAERRRSAWGSGWVSR